MVLSGTSLFTRTIPAVLIVATLGVIGPFGAAQMASRPSQVVPAATTTAPGEIALEVKGRRAVLELFQEGKKVEESGGIIHLKAAPFSVRVRGHLQLGMVASESDGLARMLKDATSPLVIYPSAIYPFTPGQMFLNAKAAIMPWKDFAWAEADREKDLLAALGGKLPVVLNCGSKWPCAAADADAKECTFEIERLVVVNETVAEPGKGPAPLDLAWEKAKAVNVVFLLTVPLIDDEFELASWRAVALAFDRK